MRVVNRHGAFCHGLQPGEEGEVNEANSGVQAALAGGLLERVEAAASEALSPPAESGDLRARFDAAWAEREARYAEVSEVSARRITALEAENAQLRLDLEAATALAKPKASTDLTADPAEANLTTDGLRRRSRG